MPGGNIGKLAFVDLTNDGWPDLVVAIGYVTNDDTADL